MKIMTLWFERQLEHYGRHHTKLSTKLTHFVGVPLVVFSVLMILAWFKLSLPPFFSTNFAWVVSIAASLFYLCLDWRSGLVLAGMLVLMSWVATWLCGSSFTVQQLIMCAALFVIGWVMQFIGHYLEAQKPAFFDDPTQMLIAPLFLVLEAAVLAGWRKDKQDLLRKYSEVYFN